MIRFRSILGATFLARSATWNGGVKRRLLGALLVAGLLTLTGCGQKGPLYLPTQAGPTSTTSPQP